MPHPSYVDVLVNVTRAKGQPTENQPAKSNFNLPKWSDIGVIGRDWPIHAKHIQYCILERLRELAKGGKMEGDMNVSIDILTKADAIKDIPTVKLDDSRCTLRDDQVAKLVENGFWEKLPDDQVALGVVRVFLVPEPFKDPPRWRVIHWTYTVNQAPNTTKVVLPTQADARRSVHLGGWSYSVDLKACFNQFPLGEEARNLYCIEHNGQWYRLMRLAMGQRQACYIAQTQTALRVLSEPLTQHKLPYIDNLKGTGIPEALRTDLQMLKSRADHAGMTFNEDLTDPDALIREVVEFVGLILDHRHKTVRVVDKVLAKLHLSWSNRNAWTVRQFCSHMSILFYIYSATGRHGEFALHELALKRWCRVQAGVAKGEFTMDDFLGNLASTVSGGVTRPEWESLATWTAEAKKNPPILVPADDHSPDFVLVTDGSGYGWGALLISTKSGLFKAAHNVWPPEWRSKYIPGSIIVADEPSRGYELDPSKLARLQQYLKQNITN
jgi:hypothetical protein